MLTVEPLEARSLLSAGPVLPPAMAALYAPAPGQASVYDALGGGDDYLRGVAMPNVVSPRADFSDVPAQIPPPLALPQGQTLADVLVEPPTVRAWIAAQPATFAPAQPPAREVEAVPFAGPLPVAAASQPAAVAVPVPAEIPAPAEIIDAQAVDALLALAVLK